MRSVLSFLVLALPFALADHQPHVNHRELAKRATGDIEKRGNARWSFYSTGLGACGGYNKDSDFIVALNQGTFGYSYPSKYCNKKITMTYNGKTTDATIVDSCPGCPDNGLDLSPGLFSFFASQDEGIIYGTWWFSDGSGGGSGGNSGGDSDPTTTKKTTTKTTHTTTHTTPAYTPPTSTYTPPTSSTTSTTTTKSSTTTTTTSSKASSSASSSHAASSVTSNSLAAASGTVSATSTADPENLYTFAQVMLDLTGVVVAGANAD